MSWPCVLAVIGLIGLLGARHGLMRMRPPSGPPHPWPKDPDEDQPRPGLKDLAVLAFVASLAFMALEMVAGRLVTRHLGSSIYGWTSVIAVLLAGLSFGNFLGGKIADFIKSEKHASWLFLVASILTLCDPRAGDARPVVPGPVLRRWQIAVRPQHGDLADLGAAARRHAGLPSPGPIACCSSSRWSSSSPRWRWGPSARSSPSSPSNRLRRFKRTGTAIGQVYAWGMVGSILGTFLTGFFLIDIARDQGGPPDPGDHAGLRARPCSGPSGTPSGRASPWASASWPSRRPDGSTGQSLPALGTRCEGLRGDRPQVGHPRGAGRSR